MLEKNGCGYNVVDVHNQTLIKIKGRETMKTSLLKYLLVVFCILAAFAIAITPARASVPQQTDLIEHGKYIATIAGCTSCHTPSRAEFLDMTKLTLPQIQTLAFDEKDAMDTSK